MYNILICDDEKDIVSALEIYLARDDYHIIPAYNGKEALEIVRKQEIHLVLLDIMMPEMDGMTALEKIRGISNVPVLFLSAKGEDMDKIRGLVAGADDYITKPFNPVELQARVRSNLRRYVELGSSPLQANVLRIGGLELNDQAKEVTLDGETVSLTRTEYDILRLLMQNPGRVFSPREIYREVWKEDPFGTENIVAVHIRHIREKIEYDPADPRYLKAVWGHGYKIESRQA